MSDWSSDVCSSDLTSGRDGSTLQLFGEVGYDARMGAAAITPFARLAHVRTKSDTFAEAGGNAALALAAAQQETDFLSLGVRARINAGQPGLAPKSGVEGQSVASRLDLGGPRIFQKKKNNDIKKIAQEPT